VSPPPDTLFTTTLEETEVRPPLATKASSNSFDCVVEKLDVETLDVDAGVDRKPLSPKAVASMARAVVTTCAPAICVTKTRRRTRTSEHRANANPAGAREVEKNLRNERRTARRDNSTLGHMRRCNLMNFGMDGAEEVALVDREGLRTVVRLRFSAEDGSLCFLLTCAGRRVAKRPKIDEGFLLKRYFR
jgi:hypothetical protein